MNSRAPKFTIVTPSLNQAPYLAETIESVLSQEGDFEIEYFIMDGGSSDGSVAIMEDYAGRVRRGEWPIRCRGIEMHYVSEPDRGQSDAINKGLRQATGTIAAYINSDDFYLPGAFSQVALTFGEHPAEFVYGDGDVIGATGAISWEWLSRPYDHALMTSYHFLWNDFTNYILQQATFWRVSVHAEIGYFDESFHYAMDVEYWVRASSRGLRLKHLPDKLARFRWVEGTKSTSSPLAFWSDHLEIFRRYHRKGCGALFWGYYCYNLAKNTGYDPEAIRQHVEKTLSRWETFEVEERLRMRKAAEEGVAIGCLLAVDDLRAKGRPGEAARFLRVHKDRGDVYSSHPVALYLKSKALIGERAMRIWDHWAAQGVGAYRKRYVDYRYHQPRLDSNSNTK